MEIEIPDLEAARLAHAVTITTEMAQAMDRFGPSQRQRMGLDVRLHLALARKIGTTHGTNYSLRFEQFPAFP